LKSLNNKHTQERGAVLIMVLLIVALVAGLGIKFAGDYQLGLARAEARWHGAQARAYMFGAEGPAIKFMMNDDPAVDYPTELWGGVVPIELPDGSGNVVITINDANSKFNLNRLLEVQADFATKPASDTARYMPPQRMFIRLLQALPNPDDPQVPLVQTPEAAIAILEAIIDWVDNDNVVSGSGGAEKEYYLGLRDPYQSADLPFRSIEELQMVRGITPQIMRALRPFITVLEPNQMLNLNTMPEIMYRCINLSTDLLPLNESQARALVAEKPITGFYANMKDFDVSWNKVGGAAGAAVDKDFDVKTKFFWLTTDVKIGEQHRVGRSLLERGIPLFKVVRREEGGF
jgi:general secretion pathway protein K